MTNALASVASVTECVDINIIIMVDHNHRESDNSVGGTIKEEEEDVGYTDDCIEPIPEEERQEDASPKLMTHQKKTREVFNSPVSRLNLRFSVATVEHSEKCTISSQFTL